MLDELDAYIESLGIRAEELRAEERYFCENCHAAPIDREPIEFWGWMTTREVDACDKGEDSCTHIDEYEKLESELEETLRRIGILEDARKIIEEEKIAEVA